MADRENEKKYSAETKGYTDKIYEVRFMPVLERSEYQAGPEREGLIKLQGIMEEKDFEKYINNGLIRITQDGDRLIILRKCRVAYGMKEPLAVYRQRPNSISSNKYSLIAYNLNVYRKVLNFSWVKSYFFFFCFFLPNFLIHKILQSYINR